MDHFSVFREHLSPSRIPTVSKEIPVVHPLIFLPFNDHYASPRYRCGLPKTASLCRDQSPWNVTRLMLKRPGCSLEKMTLKMDQGQWNTWTIITIIHISDSASPLESFFWAMQRIDQLLVTAAYLVVDTSTMDEPKNLRSYELFSKLVKDLEIWSEHWIPSWDSPKIGEQDAIQTTHGETWNKSPGLLLSRFDVAPAVVSCYFRVSSTQERRRLRQNAVESTLKRYTPFLIPGSRAATHPHPCHLLGSFIFHSFIQVPVSIRFC